MKVDDLNALLHTGGDKEDTGEAHSAVFAFVQGRAQTLHCGAVALI